MKINELVKKVTLAEGLKKSLSIAQVAEVLKCLKEIINDDLEASVAWSKYRSNEYEPKKKVERKKKRVTFTAWNKALMGKKLFDQAIKRKAKK